MCIYSLYCFVSQCITAPLMGEILNTVLKLYIGFCCGQAVYMSDVTQLVI